MNIRRLKDNISSRLTLALQQTIEVSKRFEKMKEHGM